MNDDRRTFLKKGGILGVAGITGVSGCLGDDEDVPDGDPVPEVELLTLAESVDPFRFDYGNWIADELEDDLGIPMELNPAESAQYGDLVTAVENDWDLVVRRSGAGFDPLNTMLRQYFHSEFGQGGLNWWNYSNSEIDDLLDEQREAEGDRRVEIAHEVNELLNEDMAAAPVLTQDRAMPINTDRYDNWTDQVEHGLGSFFNYFEMEPTDDEYATLEATNIEQAHSLNPFDDFGRFPRTLKGLVYDKLIRVEPPENDWVPWAAEEVEIVELDRIDVTLREGMTFTDGEEVTADDVQFTVDTALESAPQVGNRWEQLDEIEVHNDYEFTIHLEADSAEPLIWDALDNTFIVPEHVWSDVDNIIDHEEDPPIGSGPFEVTAWERGEQIELDARDDYQVRGGPNIDGILHVDSSDLRAGERRVRQGEVSQMENELSIDDVERFEEEHPEIEISRVAMISNHWLGFDHGHSPFAGDDEVRRALRHAVAHTIPKQEIISGVYGGLAEPNSQHVSTEFDQWRSPNAEEISKDVDYARGLLEDAGYEWDGDGNLYFPADYDA